MKKVVLTLSILGGITGLLSIFFIFFGHMFLSALSDTDIYISTHRAVVYSLAVIGFSILGIIGGVMARKGLKIASLPLFIACFGGLFASLPFILPFILPAIFFLIGGILALFVKK